MSITFAFISYTLLAHSRDVFYVDRINLLLPHGESPSYQSFLRAGHAAVQQYAVRRDIAVTEKGAIYFESLCNLLYHLVQLGPCLEARLSCLRNSPSEFTWFVLTQRSNLSP